MKPKVMEKRRLPNRRCGYTQKMKISGQTVFLHTGEYEDGSLLRPDFRNLISEEDLFDAEQNWNVDDRYENEKFFADEEGE